MLKITVRSGLIGPKRMLSINPKYIIAGVGCQGILNHCRPKNGQQ
jgi:hypothetical protein